MLNKTKLEEENQTLHQIYGLLTRAVNRVP